MILILWILFLVIFIVILYSLHSLQNFPNRKSIVDEKILEENVRVADQYEIAFLKGGDREVCQLAFYTLVESGYLLSVDTAGSKTYPPRKYNLDKGKDLNMLHEIEKVVALSYDESTLLPENAKELKSALPFLKKYQRKIKELSLFTPSLILLAWVKGLFIFCLCVSPLLYSTVGTFPSSNGWVNAFFLGLINVIAYLIIRKIKSPMLSYNGKKYIELFEKIHFPYPDFRKTNLAEYIEIITPCHL